MTTTSTGDPIPVVPSTRLVFENNLEALKQSDLSYIPEQLRDSIPVEFRWNLDPLTNNGVGYLTKQALVIMDIIYNNNWERPIYFSTSLASDDYMNLWDYFQLEGLAYRLLPVKTGTGQMGKVDLDVMAENMFEKFRYRNLDDPDVYYDENFRRFALILRRQFYKLAEAYLSEGKKETALKTIRFSLDKIPDKSIPYDMAVGEYPNILFATGNDSLALEITNVLATRVEENLDYLNAEGRSYDGDYYENFVVLYRLTQYLRIYGYKDRAAELNQVLNSFPQSEAFFRNASR